MESKGHDFYANCLTPDRFGCIFPLVVFSVCVLFFLTESGSRWMSVDPANAHELAEIAGDPGEFHPTGGKKMASEQPPRVVVTSTKNMGISIMLTILFGPFGMLYSTIWGAIIMAIIALVVGVLTLGVGLCVIWPICIIWGAVATSVYNQRLLAGQRRY
jgi:hypothetical protein